MKLPFNHTNTASAEIRAVLGFTDKDLTFEKLKPTIITAVDHIINLIGEPTYDTIIGYYESTETNDVQKDLINRLQYAVALDGYRNFTTENDLSHTPNGRLNRIEDNQKIAFEWQIDKSNKSLERKYYQALDALIKSLDKNLTAWKSSDAYKQTFNSFIRSTSEVEEYFNIDGSRLMMIKLSPGFRKAEVDEILPRIGSERFDALKNALKNNQPHDAKLLKLVREAIVYHSLSWSILRLSPQLLPDGLYLPADTSRLTVSAKKVHERMQQEALAQRFKEDAKTAFFNLENYIKSLNTTQTEYIPLHPGFDPKDIFVDT